MSTGIVTPVDVAVAVKEDTPSSYTFKHVQTCRGRFKKELPVTLKPEWTSYWTDDRRVYPRPPAEEPSSVGNICLPITLLFQLIAWIIVAPFMLIAYIASGIKTFVVSCKLDKEDPVVTRSQFYCWMKRNGFTKEEIKKAKKAIVEMQIQMHGIAHKLTDVRAVEETLKLQSIEKQKKVVGMLQRSMAAIDKRHAKQFERLRDRYIGAIFCWGSQGAYKLGDVVAKNGRWFGRGEGDRKKADWEQKVATKVDLRANAIVRCINTMVNDDFYDCTGSRMSDLERTINKTKRGQQLIWHDFVRRNKLHHNNLLEEIHTAAPFIKQYITHAIVTESYCQRITRLFWAWFLLLLVVAFKLAKLIVKHDISDVADILDLIVGSITSVVEAPAALVDMLENGLPTDIGSIESGLGSDFGMDSLNQKRLDNREARLDNHLDAIQHSTKHEEINEIPDDTITISTEVKA
ncbi:hypothetical protein DVH05_012101 [Phytophthora capsici]|nr:hypothetical protein DVH05_012101 [Phytophthora capsici]